MSDEREFVMLDPFEKYTDDQLVDVQGRLEEEADRVIAEVRAENKRRTEVAIKAALERAQKSGVQIALNALGGDSGDEPAAKKRGRKSAAQKAAEAEAKAAANGHADIDGEFDAPADTAV